MLPCEYYLDLHCAEYMLTVEPFRPLTTACAAAVRRPTATAMIPQERVEQLSRTMSVAQSRHVSIASRRVPALFS